MGVNYRKPEGRCQRIATCLWMQPIRGMKRCVWPGIWGLRWWCPNPQRLDQLEYDRIIYPQRNEIERLFRRLKGYRRVFSRFDKLDVAFTDFIVLALIFEATRLALTRPSRECLRRMNFYKFMTFKYFWLNNLMKIYS